MRRLDQTLIRAVALLSAFVAADFLEAAPSPFAPDAWVRGNNANTSYFGWDFIEHTGPPNLGDLWILDDGIPDLGTGITASAPRIFQGTNGLDDPSPNLQGHVSSTHNYYSFIERFDATITATPPASGAGGFTTVVLQLHSTVNGDELRDLTFGILPVSSNWTLRKHLNNTDGSGLGAEGANLGYHWLEWTAPGAGVEFRIHIDSFLAHRPVDSFEIDTFWSPTGPVINSITSVPEPATGLLAALGGLAGFCGRRRRGGRSTC
jgi:hypothetical protein